ncbi:ChaN family lipoprotein [Breoghania sp. L-A4]|uniref:ChaN family lipoprotein n=1 Tax=Breoghania sp. L-A4 TaxID=2304600 RepID=UPI000E358463|nr:ChaN family lipoprotein [Breoghania sp. L-A4]AXS40045.1 hypothetical protein D1F64_08185 [Breoghania sp. L-A4]
MKLRLAILALTACFLHAAAAKAEDPGAWRSQHFTAHPLVGRIYSAALEAFVSEDALVRDAAAARYVLLGETHDNADHHLLQARVIAALAAAGRDPAVVFEMVSVDKAQALADHLAAHPNDAAGLGEALGWSASGWPAWPFYEPVARAALDAGLTLVAGDLDPSQRKRIGTQGFDAVPPEERAELALDQPLSEGAAADLENTLRISHCGMLPDAAVSAIFKVQRARDAALARAMLSSGERPAPCLLPAAVMRARTMPCRGICVPAIRRRRSSASDSRKWNRTRSIRAPTCRGKTVRGSLMVSRRSIIFGLRPRETSAIIART